jgi:hypothetical protein
VRTFEDTDVNALAEASLAALLCHLVFLLSVIADKSGESARECRVEVGVRLVGGIEGIIIRADSTQVVLGFLDL